ncbi:HNH endonuclease [Phytoactinopolyspora halophila]|uniref:HNH endonuclease n=2 Tax=Phytoactinopolyspora halophila TaxID=1981511 RepID=A0A329R0X5_9ACTN|nr:HNH endonuclease [Phytoactinopolyspora halophila]
MTRVIDAAEDVFDQAADVDVYSVSDDDLAELLAGCHALAARQSELFLRLVGEADSRDLGRRQGASSSAAWLREMLKIRPATAKASIDLAHRLDPPEPVEDYAANVRGTSTGSMPATQGALAAGQVSADHALVIAKTMAQLPTDISPEDAARAEEDLAGFARQHDPATLQRLATHLLHVLSSESLEDREERAHRKRRLRIIDQGDGTARITGLLSNEDAATVRTALDPLAAPQPSDDGERDARSPEQRSADALVELCRRNLANGSLPTNHGHPAQLHLLAELATLAPEGTPGSHARNHDPATPSPHPRWLQDTWARRFGVAPAELAWGGPISTEALRRISCDADVTHVLVDSHGVPLRVGRTERTVTPGIWTALIARDRGCAFPGCTRPPAWCHAHHIHHWADGGATDLENLVLLCGHHHRSIHHGGWNVRLGHDGHPEFLPPRWFDPDRGPRRNIRPRHDRQPPPRHAGRDGEDRDHRRPDHHGQTNGQSRGQSHERGRKRRHSRHAGGRRPPPDEGTPSKLDG